MFDSIQHHDRAAMRWIARHRPRSLTLALAALTYTGAGAVWGISATALAVLCRFDLRILPRQETLLAAMFGAGLSLIVGQILKRVVRRPRPVDVLEAAPVAIPPPSRSAISPQRVPKRSARGAEPDRAWRTSRTEVVRLSCWRS